MYVYIYIYIYIYIYEYWTRLRRPDCPYGGNPGKLTGPMDGGGGLKK